MVVVQALVRDNGGWQKGADQEFQTIDAAFLRGWPPLQECLEENGAIQVSLRVWVICGKWRGVQRVGPGNRRMKVRKLSSGLGSHA